MAYTRTFVVSTDWGNKRVVMFKVVSDATSGLVDSGLGVIEAVQWAPCSMSTTTNGWPIFKLNELTAATASNGKLHIAQLASSGDDLWVTCIGH